MAAIGYLAAVKASTAWAVAASLARSDRCPNGSIGLTSEAEDVEHSVEL